MRQLQLHSVGYRQTDLLRREISKQIRSVFKGAIRVIIRHLDDATFATAVYTHGVRDYIYVRHSDVLICGERCILHIMDVSTGKEEVL